MYVTWTTFRTELRCAELVCVPSWYSWGNYTAGFENVEKNGK